MSDDNSDSKPVTFKKKSLVSSLKKPVAQSHKLLILCPALPRELLGCDEESIRKFMNSLNDNYLPASMRSNAEGRESELATFVKKVSKAQAEVDIQGTVKSRLEAINEQLKILETSANLFYVLVASTHATQFNFSNVEMDNDGTGLAEKMLAIVTNVAENKPREDWRSEECSIAGKRAIWGLAVEQMKCILRPIRTWLVTFF